MVVRPARVGRVHSIALTWISVLSTITAFTLRPALLKNRPKSCTLASSLLATVCPDIVVISPPGGLGEIASIEAASRGGSVRWLVVSSNSPSRQSSTLPLALTAHTLATIEKAGGSIELSGTDSTSLQSGSDDGNDAVSAISSWCRETRAIICTYDGVEEEKRRMNRNRKGNEPEIGNVDEMIRTGIRIAAREANSVAASNAVKVAMLHLREEITGDKTTMEEKRGPFQTFFQGSKKIPETLSDAMNGSINIIRYGELFGAAESSPESSAFIGGPLRDPVIREMYTMRSVRIDPTISVSAKSMTVGPKSNRLAIGAAASHLGLGKTIIADEFQGIDVSLSSFAGTIPPTEEDWSYEFNRVLDIILSPGGGATLFSAEFSSVPSIKRLADWIATKWAPAILRSYDIAGIRVGGRPVFTIQTADDTVEIVWQDLVNFDSVTSGKMIIKITENGMIASRAAGDAAAGFGSISMKPLPGEDILVRRLADAASQAIEKGLALKPNVRVLEKVQTAVAQLDESVMANTVSSNVNDISPSRSSDSGPRSAGARRSSERSRGKKNMSFPVD